MIEIEQQTMCKYCGQPLPPSAGRNHRKREYCNDVHRQLAYRQRREQEARETSKQRWSAFLPETQAVLNDILQLRGEAFAGRVASVILSELARLQDASNTARISKSGSALM